MTMTPNESETSAKGRFFKLIPDERILVVHKTCLIPPQGHKNLAKFSKLESFENHKKFGTLFKLDAFWQQYYNDFLNINVLYYHTHEYVFKSHFFAI